MTFIIPAPGCECNNVLINFVTNIFTDLMGDLIRQRPKETDGVESIVVVDGVPQVGADRLEKLQNVLRKFFVKFGKITNEYYALNSDGSTKGYVFRYFLVKFHE